MNGPEKFSITTEKGVEATPIAMSGDTGLLDEVQLSVMARMIDMIVESGKPVEAHILGDRVVFSEIEE